MGRTGAFVGAAAILVAGGLLALPDDPPEYLGDMPSTLEQAASTPAPAPRPEPGPAAGGPPPPLRGPLPVVLEAPPCDAVPAPAAHAPAPTTNTAWTYQPGSTAGDDAAEAPVLGILADLTGAPGEHAG